MSFDWSISLSAVLITVTNLVAMVGLAWRLTRRFSMMEKKVNIMFAWFLRQLKIEIPEDELKAFFDINGGDKK